MALGPPPIPRLGGPRHSSRPGHFLFIFIFFFFTPTSNPFLHFIVVKHVRQNKPKLLRSVNSTGDIYNLNIKNFLGFSQMISSLGYLPKTLNLEFKIRKLESRKQKSVSSLFRIIFFCFYFSDYNARFH